MTKLSCIRTISERFEYVLGILRSDKATLCHELPFTEHTPDPGHLGSYSTRKVIDGAKDPVPLFPERDSVHLTDYLNSQHLQKLVETQAQLETPPYKRIELNLM